MAPKTEKQRDEDYGFKIEYHATPRTLLVKVSIRTLNLALLTGTAGLIGAFCNAVFKWIMAFVAVGN